MIFYLCQTEDGPQLAGTQADAKALDRNYEQVDLATDKAGYMAYVNILLRTSTPASAPEPYVEQDEEGEPRLVAPEPDLKHKNKGGPDWQSAPPAGSCKRCISMSAAARQIEGIMAATNIEQTLYDCDEPFLDRIQAVITARRDENKGKKK